MSTQNHESRSNGHAFQDEKVQVKQYAAYDGNEYYGTGLVAPKLEAGVYVLREHPRRGIGVQKQIKRKANYLEIDSNEIQFVFHDFKLFWERKSQFIEFGQTFKRGSILYGPQGCGKSQLIGQMEEWLEKKFDGVTIYVDTDPQLLIYMLQVIREIEKTRPLMIVFEDIDSLFDRFNETNVLQVLDGFSSTTDVYFVATTNNPDRLQARVTNRPQRFDIAIEFPLPSSKARRSFIEGRAKQYGKKVNVQEFVELTDGMTFSHIQEVFISVFVMEYSITKTIQRMSSLGKTKSITSTPTVGFGAGNNLEEQSPDYTREEDTVEEKSA